MNTAHAETSLALYDLYALRQAEGLRVLNVLAVNQQAYAATSSMPVIPAQRTNLKNTLKRRKFSWKGGAVR